MLKGPLRSLQWIFHTFHVMVIQEERDDWGRGFANHPAPHVYTMDIMEVQEWIAYCCWGRFRLFLMA